MRITLKSTVSKNGLKIALAGLALCGIVGCGSSPSNGGGSTTTGGGGSTGGGSSTGGTTTTTTTTTTSPTAAATYLYAIQNPTVQTFQSGTGEVLEFAAGANGNVTPVAALTAPTDMYIYSLTTDASGQIYVGGYLASGAAAIEVYAAGASGTPAPVRTITIASGYAPTAMTVDANGSLYTVDGDSEFLVYASTASGMAVPTRLVSGAATGLNYPNSIAVDASGNVYVSSPALYGSSTPGIILVFAPTAAGDAAPLRTITNATSVFLGVATDASGNLYATLDGTASPYTSSIVEFAPGANGAATPIRTIAGAATELSTAGGLCVDAVGNIYVANQITTANGYSFSIDEFAATASGNAAPVSVLTSASITNLGEEIAIH